MQPSTKKLNTHEYHGLESGEPQQYNLQLLSHKEH